MNRDTGSLYAGLSQVHYCGGPFDLGYGVTIRPTYAHLFAAYMMAFEEASDGRPHPAPWRAAKGGFGHDIHVELTVPTSAKLPGGIDPVDAIWLVAALLRLARYPQLLVCAVADVAFESLATTDYSSSIRPMEVEARIFGIASGKHVEIELDTLEWVRSVWPRTAQLIRTNPTFDTSLRAADACAVKGRPASALLMVWGALEQLFAPSRAELRFRVSAHIAAYLEPPGPNRLSLFKHVAHLYNARSKAAHSAEDSEKDSLLQSFVILRNALIRIIDESRVPEQDRLEQLLFCGE